MVRSVVVVLLPYFNSIKVRLEPSCCRSSRKLPSFQFHKGTIRTGVLLEYATVLFNFNSIKVRLEHILQTLILLISLQFQFHKGTIRTSIKLSLLTPNLNFNSIKVRLELICTLLKRCFMSHFNSIKVRLEHDKKLRREVRLQFQFHKGTIRTKH